MYQATECQQEGGVVSMIHLASIFNQTFADLHWCANKLREHKNMEYRTGNNMEHKRTRKKEVRKVHVVVDELYSI